MDWYQWALIVAPFLFALGWIAARIDIRYLKRELRTLPSHYAQGALQLVQGQSDAAIDAFVKVLQQDSDSIDMYFTLAHLLRRRGDSAQAIRLHQNLLDRPDLSPAQYDEARYELGLDFLKAGLLDRAEAQFIQIRNTSQQDKFLQLSQNALLEIYQRQKDWWRAIDSAKTVESVTAVAQHQRIAHFFCELAQDEMARQNYTSAQSLWQQARAANAGSVRASIGIGDLYLAQNQPQTAIEEWLKIESQNVQSLGLVAHRLRQTYRQCDRAQEGINVLSNFLTQHFSVDILIEVLAERQLEFGTPAALGWLQQVLHTTPSLVGIDQLLHLHLQHIPQTDSPLAHDMMLYRQQIHVLVQKLSRYRCTHCGFRARQFYWQCPGCQQWDSTQPFRTEDLMLMQ